MSAPSSLPPLVQPPRRPRPSGLHERRERPWWGKFDILCMFGVLLGMLGTILGLIGALPHVADDAVKILNALHGSAAAQAGESDESDHNGGGGKPEGDLRDHAASVVTPAAPSTPVPPGGTR